MMNFEELIYKYKRLLNLMDEDYVDISQAIQGEMLDSYRYILLEEKGMIDELIKELRSLF